MCCASACFYQHEELLGAQETSSQSPIQKELSLKGRTKQMQKRARLDICPTPIKDEAPKRKSENCWFLPLLTQRAKPVMSECMKSELKTRPRGHHGSESRSPLRERNILFTQLTFPDINTNLQPDESFRELSQMMTHRLDNTPFTDLQGCVVMA